MITLSGDTPEEFVFEIDLTVEEARRRAEVLRAMGDSWDPVAALRDEQAAHALLYSGLDEQQQAVYDQLVRAGVLEGSGMPGERGASS